MIKKRFITVYTATQCTFIIRYDLFKHINCLTNKMRIIIQAILHFKLAGNTVLVNMLLIKLLFQCFVNNFLLQDLQFLVLMCFSCICIIIILAVYIELFIQFIFMYNVLACLVRNCIIQEICFYFILLLL